MRTRQASVPLFPGDDALARTAEPVDGQLDEIAVIEKARRLPAESDARGRARRNHVAREQRHELRDVAHEVRHVEDEVPRGAVLHALAVDVEAQAKGVHVGHLVGRREPRPEGCERVPALPLEPLPATLELERPFGVVVVERVPGDVERCLARGDDPGLLADHHRELDFPIGLDGVRRHQHVVEGTAERRCRLGEQDRLRRRHRAGLGGVVGVVESDAHDLRRACDARTPSAPPPARRGACRRAGRPASP